MSISAAHFNEVTNGYEKQSDGLWVHKGKLSVGQPGTSSGGQPGDLSVNRGNSQGAIYFGGMGAANYIYYNGVGWQFSPLLTGGAIADGTIATADLADGSVTTAKLAAGAAQVLIGSYVASPTWSTTTTSTWLATTVATASISCSGAQVRVECTFVILHTLATAVVYGGLMVDGALFQASLTVTSNPTANSLVPLHFTYYLTPSAANHTFALTLYNANTGTLSLSSGAVQTLYVTEQRR